MPLGALRRSLGGSRAMVRVRLSRDLAQVSAMRWCRSSWSLQGLIGQHSGAVRRHPGMLERLDAAGCAWGIVTNKPEYLAR